MRIRSRFIALVLAAAVAHAGPVSAYLCIDHDSPMKSCCPDGGHAATDHGTMIMSPDAGMDGTCDPVTTDGASARSLELPDPLAVGVDLVSSPVTVRAVSQTKFSALRLRDHGPPVYLATARLRR